MQEVGRVLSVRGKNLVLLRGTKALKEGTKLYDDQQNQVGVVKEVLGPTRAPYMLARVKHPKKLLGKKLYH
ncbi:hypothetical protein DRN74_03385 [Candidatus Micrarchaeota archaeon]|nr:MAG: hypothetical protein DRN74_03385 [Candidatus Micrarchaeota archaeon]